MKIKITAINSGSSDAYQTSYKYIFSKYVKLLNFGDILDKKNILQLAKNESTLMIRHIQFCFVIKHLQLIAIIHSLHQPLW